MIHAHFPLRGLPFTNAESKVQAPKRRPLESGPTIVLVKMTARATAVERALDGEYRVFCARHVQAACRFIAKHATALVVGSEHMAFYDVDVLRANMPGSALFRLAPPGLDALDIALVVRKIYRVLASRPNES